MTWRVKSKLAQNGLVGSFTVPVVAHLPADASDNDSSAEYAVFSAAPFVQQTGYGGGYGSNSGHDDPYTADTNSYVILRAYLVTDSAITGTGSSGAGATATVELYDSAGASVGTLFSLAFNTGTDTVAFVPKSLGSPSTSVRSISGGCLIRENEGLTFKWTQGSTGLALPNAILVMDIQ